MIGLITKASTIDRGPLSGTIQMIAIGAIVTMDRLITKAGEIDLVVNTSPVQSTMDIVGNRAWIQAMTVKGQSIHG